jgi:hypothetical protein
LDNFHPIFPCHRKSTAYAIFSKGVLLLCFLFGVQSNSSGLLRSTKFVVQATGLHWFIEAVVLGGKDSNSLTLKFATVHEK